ncbi:hypothetical protein [Herbiconiux liukaitaii]|uniref:hypothetical protein n=1 Tax=Herbiconiux liukaitaii TaxID=3342799 RepID=UPI0035BB053E
MSASSSDPRQPSHPRKITLTREEIIDGLRDLVVSLRTDGHRARLQIVGGAAIALMLDAGRRATRDVDGPLTPPEVIIAAAEKIAATRGWPQDWVNDSAAQFVPHGYGRSAEWRTVYDRDDVVIQIASAETLLAMKLFAAEKRYLREAEDLAVLLHATGIDTVEHAETLYAEFYPGDEFSPRLFELVESILSSSFRAPPVPPPPTFE